MNLALDTKILWRLTRGKKEWWKDVIYKYYLIRGRLKNLDVSLPEINGSPIWRLCKETTPIIQDQLSWVSRNGKLIWIWEDKVLGHPPLP